MALLTFSFTPSAGLLFGVSCMNAWFVNVWCLIQYPNFTKHPSNMRVFPTDLDCNKVKGQASTEEQTSYWWHDRPPTLLWFLSAGFEDQVWAWLHSDWLLRPGPCSLWLLRCAAAAATCNLLWTRLTDQLWGTHCICLFLELVRFMNNMCTPCFDLQSPC